MPITNIYFTLHTIINSQEPSNPCIQCTPHSLFYSTIGPQEEEEERRHKEETWTTATRRRVPVISMRSSVMTEAEQLYEESYDGSSVCI